MGKNQDFFTPMKSWDSCKEREKKYLFLEKCQYETKQVVSTLCLCIFSTNQD